jgi:hypothetical protein
MQMARARAEIALPMDTLIEQFSSATVAPAVKNFTKIYLEMGFPRLARDAQLALAPKLLAACIGRTDEQRHAIHVKFLKRKEGYEEKHEDDISTLDLKKKR